MLARLHEKDAMAALADQTRDVLSFGPFRLVVRERLLTKASAPVDLGGRTLDTLIALVARPNEVVSKRDLLAQVWPDVSVEEGSLRFHIASLRKALGDGKDGARYIATVAGRGYCFVAPVSRSDSGNVHTGAAPSFPYSNLPSRLMRMVGRDNDLLGLSTQLTASRFVTVVGAGGVGKTTVAVALGHQLIEAFAGAALFVDLGMLSDPDLAATALASMLGLSVQSNDATPSLIAYLRDKRILLILDTCEHIIEAVAALASQIFMAAPQVHILATSREALQVEGEHVYRLDPLAMSARRLRRSPQRLPGRSRRPSSSSNARRRAAPAWSSTTRKRQSWSAFAGGSTAWRWRSSWPPDGSRPTGCSKPLRFSTSA